MTIAPNDPALDGLADAVDRVLAGRPLRTSRRLSQLLRYVTDETLAGRGGLLRERTIAVEALGCPPSFDPRFDPMVRVLASRLRKGLDRHYAGDGAADPIRVEMPRGGYAVRARAASRPVETPASSADGPVVAVSTFADLTDDPGLAHLAVGLTEAVVANLSSFRGCRTVGPIGRAPSDDEARWAQELGATVGATHVLQGTTRTAGGVLRVTVRLSDAASGQTVWSQRIDHPIADQQLFAIEDRIARQVSGTLGDYGGVVHQRRGPQLERPAGSYDAMLRYYAYLATLDPDVSASTTEALERAVEDRPDDALLLAMLAGMVLFRGVGRLGDVGEANVTDGEVERADELAHRSLRIDAGNPHATAVLAFVELVRGHPDRCRLHLDRVLDASPSNPSLLFMVGVGHAMSGDWSAGVHHIQESMELNPLHPGWYHGFLVLDALLHGDPDQALAAAQRVDTPGLVWGSVLRAAALASADRLDEAADELAELERRTLALPDPSDGREAFANHLRLPDEVVAVLVDALAKVPPRPST